MGQSVTLILITVTPKGYDIMKTAAYVRVSTQDQAGEDRFGLTDQKQAIEAYAKSHGHEVVAWYSDEVSGATLDRPGLQELLTHSGKDMFKAVLVTKMDRVARDLMAQLWIEKELLRHDIEIISTAEPFRGQNPANVLFRQIIGAFAQFEKARITERMSGGRKAKAKIGGYAGGGAAIGYQVQRGAKVVSLDPSKSETVRKVFEIRKRHPRWSLQDIAGRLNEEGYTTSEGKPFHRVQVKRVLERKDLYRGEYVYGGVRAKGQHEAIL